MTAIKQILCLLCFLLLPGCQHKVEMGAGPLTILNLKKNIYPQKLPKDRIVTDRASAWMASKKFCFYYYVALGYTFTSGKILPVHPNANLGEMFQRLKDSGVGSGSVLMHHDIFLINYERNYEIRISDEDIKSGAALKREISPGDIIYVFTTGEIDVEKTIRRGY